MASLTVESATDFLGYCPCIVCFKNVFRHHQNAQETNSNLLQLFIKLLERVSLSPAIFPKKVGLCNDCAVIVKSVTKLFHQIQCIQLELDWNLDKVRRVMVLADMVPSRRKEFQKMYKCNEMTTGDLEQFRNEIKNNLKRYKATSFPKVVLYSPARSTSSVLGLVGKNNKFPSISDSDDAAQSHDIKLVQMSAFKMTSTAFYFGLGWIASFVSVASLCGSSSDGNGRFLGVSTRTMESQVDSCDKTRDDKSCTMDVDEAQMEVPDGVETDSTKAVSDCDPYETADDDYCDMEVGGGSEEIPGQDAKTTPPELLIGTVVASEFAPVHLEKTNVTLPIPPSLSPTLSSTNNEEFERDCLKTATISTRVSNKPLKQDTNQKYESERRLLRRQYKCSCLMTFSTLQRLEYHKKTCETEVDKDTGTESDSDDLGTSKKELDIQIEDPWLKTEVLENDSGSEFTSDSSMPSDNESKANVVMIKEVQSLEVNGVFQCLSCKKSVQLDGFEYEKFKKFHNAHMHSNGQTVLDPNTAQLLKIAAKDVKLNSRKFTKRICSHPECKSTVFADNDSFEYHKSLHGTFKCGVCEFECSFAVQLAIHELGHGHKSETSESMMTCPRCPFEANADYNYKYYNHFLEAHLNLKTQETKCGVCTKTFLDLSVPLYHFVNEHDVSRLGNVSSVSKCSKEGCNAYFLKKCQLYLHHTNSHPKVKAPKPRSSRRSFKCCHCKARFDKKRQLLIHRSIFHKDGTNSVGIRKITPEGVTINDIVHKVNAKFLCSVEKCEEKFMTEEELDTHSKLHGTFPCQFCSKVFEFAPDLPLHEKIHRFLKSFSATVGPRKYKFNCSRCDYKTNFRKRYVHHHLETHLGLVPDQIKCPICNSSFHEIGENNLKKSIFKHWNVFHNSASLEVGQCFVNCDMCSAYFVTGLQMSGHKTKIHKIELNDRDKARNKRMHMCPIPNCKKCFDSQEHIKTHLQTTHARKSQVGPVKVYKCKRCATVIKTSNYAKVVMSHNRYKHSNGQKVLSMSTIRTLNLTADNVKLPDSFPKQNCPHEGCERKIFVSDSRLKFHQGLHGDFTCNTCDFKCNFAIDLITHELGHSTASAVNQIARVTCSRCKMNPTDVLRHFLQNHLNIHTTDGSKCDICQASFQDIEVPFEHFVNEHDLNRLDDKPSVYKCKSDNDNCRAYFLTDAQLQVHIQRIHGDGDGNSAPLLTLEFRCMQCLKQFNSRGSLRKHQVLVHSREFTSDGLTINDLINNTNAKYFCGVKGCNESFFTDEDLSKHFKLHGQFSCSLCPVEKSFAPDLSLHAMEHSTRGKSSSNYSCCLCEFNSLRKLKYVEHYLETHMGLSADVVRCPICRQGFYCNRSGLRRSLLSHQSLFHDLAALEPGASSVKCDNCPAYFLTEIQLSQHKAHIHGFQDNWKTCIDCNKTLSSYHTFIMHRRRKHFVDENDFQFLCDVVNCKEKFENKIGLEWHKLQAHSLQSGTLKCPQCEKVFKNKPSFDLHVKNHGKVKQKRVWKKTSPFVCEQCGKTFKAKILLETHKLRHVGPDGWEFVCEKCSRKFSNKYNLAQHMRVHTKEKPFVCEVCGEKYAHKHNWKAHMNSKHNANLPTRHIDTTNMKSTRKGKKLAKYGPLPESSESD